MQGQSRTWQHLGSILQSLTAHRQKANKPTQQTTETETLCQSWANSSYVCGTHVWFASNDTRRKHWVLLSEATACTLWANLALLFFDYLLICSFISLGCRLLIFLQMVQKCQIQGKCMVSVEAIELQELRIQPLFPVFTVPPELMKGPLVSF